jgi:hypothetical protein
MKKLGVLSALALIGFVSVSASAMPKSYQVTGPVLAMTADTITVQKGSDKWEIARGTAGVPADVKVGSKVMIEYTMTADKVTAKAAPAPKEE